MKCHACKYEGKYEDFDYLEFHVDNEDDTEVDVNLRFKKPYQGRGINFITIRVCPECGTLKIEQ